MLLLKSTKRNSVLEEVPDMIDFVSYDSNSYSESELLYEQLWLDAACPGLFFDGVSGLDR